jgi:hypothetical protein
MRTLMVAAIIALLAGSAYGQSLPPVNIPVGSDKPKAPTDPAKEKAYNSALGGLPNKKAADPWGNVRPAAPAPAAKKTN